MAHSPSRKSKSAVQKKVTPKSKPIQGNSAGKDKGRPTTATLLVQMALNGNAQLFHTADHVAYVVSARDGEAPEVVRLRSSVFASFLKMLYHAAMCGQKTAGSQAVADAIGVLEGIALFNSPEGIVHRRLAEKDGHIYLDLANGARQVVEVDTAGWRITTHPPVYFVRPRGMLALPEPKRGGSLDQLRPFLNISGDEDWRLAVAWLLAALRPQGPYPLMVLSGQQGSSKSTIARVVRALVDPNGAPIRCEPNEPRNLMIAANASWILAFDNLSSIPPWLSDALCRLSTGGGFSTRQLFTDDDEMIFDAQRPVILTSIEDVTTRGDLLERSLILSLPPIPEHKRCPEKELWERFDAKYPYILGALLDALSGALRDLPRVKLPRLPRMADFAVWATACERALGWPAGSFLAAYEANRVSANDVALESSPLVNPLRELLTHSTEWNGTAAELLETLTNLAGERAARGRDWPKNGQVLSGKLRRLAPNLAAVGIAIDLGGRAGKSRKRIITASAERVRENASAASAPSAHAEKAEKYTVPSGRAADAADALDTQADASGLESVRPKQAENQQKTAQADAADGATAFSPPRSADIIPDGPDPHSQWN